MIKKVLYSVILFLGWLSTSDNCHAQKFTATKTVNKTFAAPREMLFEIDSEKANITVVPAKGSSIVLKITQTARNNNELQGKNDLSVLKYTEVINRERVLVRAFISIPIGNSNITSLLNNDITVELPANCHLKIKNRLGDIVIKGVQTSINLNTEYSNVNISASGCKTNITMKLGELTLSDSRIDGSVETNNCKIRTQNITGRIVANTNMGSAILNLAASGFALDATTNNTDFTIIDKEKRSYNYNISTKSGKIVAEELQANNKASNVSESVLQYKATNPKGDIVIKSAFGNIYIY